MTKKLKKTFTLNLSSNSDRLTISCIASSSFMTLFWKTLKGAPYGLWQGMGWWKEARFQHIADKKELGNCLGMKGTRARTIACPLFLRSRTSWIRRKRVSADKLLSFSRCTRSFEHNICVVYEIWAVWKSDFANSYCAISHLFQRKQWGIWNNCSRVKFFHLVTFMIFIIIRTSFANVSKFHAILLLRIKSNYLIKCHNLFIFTLTIRFPKWRFQDTNHNPKSSPYPLNSGENM